MAQLTVVHVDDALPGDALNIDAELVALLNMVVEHGGQQVVGGTDSVEVSGKVQVDVLHGDDLAQPPPAAPPFTPKTGPSEGSRRATALLTPRRRRPSARPMVVVVLPSPRAWD